MQCIKFIGIDLAKSVFQLALADKHHHIIGSKRLSRSQFKAYFVNHPPVHIIMETCGSANYWARSFIAQGHEVTLLPAQYVKPYVRRNKTDRNDAIALIEASRNAELHSVPVKSEHQQALQSLHRLRTQYMRTRNARINTLRGMLREFGVTVPMGPRAAIKGAMAALEQLPELLRPAVCAVIEELHELEQRMKAIEQQFKAEVKADPVLQRFMQIAGVGLLTATATRAAVPTPSQFRNGRQFSAWLGLTPREYSSGDHRYLGRITKRGDKYLRTLFVHGARSVMVRIKTQQRSGQPLTHLQTWAAQLEQRVGHNKATVALANKMARILWATWMHQRDFDGNYAAAIN
jgi:transposase